MGAVRLRTNRVIYSLGPKPDPSLISYDLFHDLFLILNETWQATFAIVSPSDMPSKANGLPVQAAWMSYISPMFSSLVAPPLSAVVEHQSNGGLLIAATRDVFETTNQAHMAAAREIEAALQPLSQIPNPNDALYR